MTKPARSDRLGPDRLGPGPLVTRNELAKLFGVVPSSINKYQDLGMPVVKKGRRGVPDQFDTAACLWWRIDYVVRQKTGNIGDGLSLRKQTAEVALKEMELERKARQLLPIGWVVEILKLEKAQLSKLMNGIAAEVAPLLAREKDVTRCHRILDQAINDFKTRAIEREPLTEAMQKLELK